MEFDKLLQELEIHAATLMARFCGNEALLQRFICKFPTEKTFKELKDAFQEGRFEDAERAVHTLKGIAANLGFERLHRDCVDMLDALRGSQEGLEGKFAVISVEYQRLTSCIDCYASSIEKKGLE